MCYSVQQNASIKELTERFNAQFILPELYQPKTVVNGFDFPLLPVLTAKNTQQFEMMNWGLIPYWAKSNEIRKSTLNAKIETMSTLPSFKDVVSNRCVLPVTGFYEWKWLDSKGKRKEKYLIQTQEPVFSLAGLHSQWKNPQNGEVIHSFSLLTTRANAVMSEIHNIKKRMPLIMNVQQSMEWLQMGNMQLTEELKTKCIESDGQLGLF